MLQDEVAASQGIRIRRRPPTGPPSHYVGPFEFRIQNEGNTPRNILEEIIWHKNTEVSQVICSPFVYFQTNKLWWVAFNANSNCFFSSKRESLFLHWRNLSKVLLQPEILLELSGKLVFELDSLVWLLKLRRLLQAGESLDRILIQYVYYYCTYIHTYIYIYWFFFFQLYIWFYCWAKFHTFQCIGHNKITWSTFMLTGRRVILWHIF